MNRRLLAATGAAAHLVLGSAIAAMVLGTAAPAGAAPLPPGRSGRNHPGTPRQAFGERIEVSRVIVEVRVIDVEGAPVADLGAGDFEVRLDGRPVAVEAVEWRMAPGAGYAAPEAVPGSTLSAANGGRAAAVEAADLLVIFLQSADFVMATKAVGHLRMLPRLEEMVGRLAPGQRAAVLRHGGSLRLESDFTADPGRLRAAIRHAVLGGPEPEGPAGLRSRSAGDAPSLAAGLDPERARRASSPARALAVAADALVPLPGSKSIVYVGWGLTGSGRDRDQARAALAAARAPVFVLDVTSADSHLLEAGLRHLADVSGGTYASTYHFPDGAVHRLELALTGRYTLVLRAPRLPPGVHPLRVRLAPGAARFGRWLLAPEVVRVAE